MSKFTSGLIRHDSVLSVWCCCCGSEWEELWIGAMLLDEEIPLGNLCPRCLNCSPQVTAERLRQLSIGVQTQVVRMRRLLQSGGGSQSQKLTAQISQIHTEAIQRRLELLRNVEKSAELHARARRLMRGLADATRESQKLLEESRRLINGHFSTARRPAQPLPVEFLDEVAAGAELLLSVTNFFPQIEKWPTTVNELIEAERQCLRQRLGGMSDEDIRLIVDERYRVFIATGAA